MSDKKIIFSDVHFSQLGVVLLCQILFLPYSKRKNTDTCLSTMLSKIEMLEVLRDYDTDNARAEARTTEVFWQYLSNRMIICVKSLLHYQSSCYPNIWNFQKKFERKNQLFFVFAKTI